MLHLRVGNGLGHGVDRAAGHVCRLQNLQPMLGAMVQRTGQGVRAQREHTPEVVEAMQHMAQAAAQVNEQVGGSQVTLGEACELIHQGDDLVRRRLGDVTGETAASLCDSQRLTAEGVDLTVRASSILDAITEAISRVEDTGQGIADMRRTTCVWEIRTKTYWLFEITWTKTDFCVSAMGLDNKNTYLKQ